MRGQTLANVLYKLKAELGKALDSTSTAEDTKLYQLIETGQQELADAYNWGFLKSRWDALLPPGTRFAVYPTTLSPQGGAVSVNATIDFNRPCVMQVKWNNIWQPVVYGIDEQPEFNYLDSDRNQVLDPVQRWQMSDETQFEVWPMPATTAQVRFTQNRSLTTLQTGTTTPPTFNPAALLDLDDVLVVLQVAINLAAFEKKNNLQALAARFKTRLSLLLGNNPTRTETITVGRGMPMDRRAIRLVPMVLTAGGTKP
jgi:hypothetical protein